MNSYGLNVIRQPGICTAGSRHAVELLPRTFIARQPDIRAAKPLVHTSSVRQPVIHTVEPLVHVFIINQPNKHTTSPLGHMLVTVSSLNNPG